jgi:hypothetical protein
MVLMNLKSTNSSLRSILLFKKIMGDTPGIPALVGEEFGASHIKDLPSIIPHRSVLFPIGLLQMRPYLVFVCNHFAKPVLHSVSV